MTAAPWLSTGVRIALLTLLYAGAGHLMLNADDGIGIAAPLWPAAGIAFAFVHAYGPVTAIGAFLGSFAVNAPGLLAGTLDDGPAVVAAVLFAVGAALQALVGSALVHRFVGRGPLEHAQPIMLFLLLPGPLATLIAATSGVLLQLWFHVIPVTGALEAWVTWWVGDTIGVAVFGTLTLMCLRSFAAVWAGRRLKIAIPVAVAFALAFLTLRNDMEVRHTQAEMRLDGIAKAAAADLDRTLVSHIEALEGVRGLYLASADVSREEFRTFVSGPLSRLSGLHAVSWNPVLSGNELAVFEQRMRTQAGFEGYTVTERAADGTLIAATPRTTHVAVGYIEPLSTNAAALGFDILSNPQRAVSIREAFATGRLQATPPVDLAQDAFSQKGVLVMVPIPDQAGGTAAFAVGVLRMTDLLRSTFGTPEWDDLRVRLTDVTDRNAPAPLGTIGDFSYRSSSTEGDENNPVMNRYLTVGERKWQLAVRADPGYFAQLEGGLRLGTLIGLDLLFLLLMAFLLLMTGAEQRAHRLARRSNFEALHDPLTGLINRRGFDDRLEEMRETAMRDGSPHVLMFLDLDEFKPINDNHGHDAGDAMLTAVGRALRDGVRDSDTVARVGGDEFCVILGNCPPDRGLEIAQQLTVAVAECILDWHGTPLSVGASIGVVHIQGSHVPTAEELVRRADMACYDSKRAGRGRVRVYEATRS